MNINIEVIDKPKTNINEEIKILNSSEVINLKEVQVIKNAIKEHLIFIGLDRCNNVRNISLLGIGTSSEILIDSKDIIRAAILSASEKVILVHNHPSNSLKPSNKDLHITNVTKEILKPFNIELLDHIIVTEKSYANIMDIKEFEKEIKNKTLDNMSKGFLIEENQKLQKELYDLKEKFRENQIQQYEEYNYEEEFEI